MALNMEKQSLKEGRRKSWPGALFQSGVRPRNVLALDGLGILPCLILNNHHLAWLRGNCGLLRHLDSSSHTSLPVSCSNIHFFWLQASGVTNEGPKATFSSGNLHCWRSFFLPCPIFTWLFCNLHMTRYKAGKSLEWISLG